MFFLLIEQRSLQSEHTWGRIGSVQLRVMRLHWMMCLQAKQMMKKRRKRRKWRNRCPWLWPLPSTSTDTTHSPTTLTSDRRYYTQVYAYIKNSNNSKSQLLPYCQTRIRDPSTAILVDIYTLKILAGNDVEWSMIIKFTLSISKLSSKSVSTEESIFRLNWPRTVVPYESRYFLCKIVAQNAIYVVNFVVLNLLFNERFAKKFWYSRLRVLSNGIEADYSRNKCNR